MSELGKYWKQAETFKDVRIGLRAKVRLGIKTSSTKEGVITHITKNHVIVELDNRIGEISLNKYMMPALQFWYDLEEEKRRNEEIDRKKLELKRLSASPIQAVSQGDKPQLEEFNDEENW